MQMVDDFVEIAQAPSRAALHAAAERLIGDLEFERYELNFVVDHPTGEVKRWSTIGNVPDGYLTQYQGSGKRCPVMQHAKKNSWPLYWGKDLYDQHGMRLDFEEQAAWGYGTGFIVAAHLPQNKHVVVGVEREQPLTDTGPQLTHKVSSFQLFATFVIDACVTVMGNEESTTCDCPLSARELDALRWTLAGKTAWEVGRILGISSGTASQHAHNAARKLDAVNKHQAALKALRLGWIDPQ